MMEEEFNHFSQRGNSTRLNFEKVEKETEKAFLFLVRENLKIWVPKSVVKFHTDDHAIIYTNFYKRAIKPKLNKDSTK